MAFLFGAAAAKATSLLPALCAGGAAAGLGATYLATRNKSENVRDYSSTSDDISNVNCYPHPAPACDRARSRKYSNQSRDEEEQSSESEEESEEESDDDYDRNYSVSVSSHIRARLLRFIRYGGIIQRISENTDICRWHVARCNASEFQDRSSGRSGYHAAHVVRVSDIHSQIRKRYRRHYNELKNFGGHTQIVRIYANRWHGLGGDIDRLQARFIDTLADIDFSSSLDAEAESILIKIRDYFVDILNKHIKKSKYTTEEKYELEKAIEKIYDLDIDDLFEKGQDGYNGKHDNY